MVTALIADMDIKQQVRDSLGPVSSLHQCSYRNNTDCPLPRTVYGLPRDGPWRRMATCKKQLFSDPCMLRMSRGQCGARWDRQLLTIA